jgi:hypothetical protein
MNGVGRRERPASDPLAVDLTFRRLERRLGPDANGCNDLARLRWRITERFRLGLPCVSRSRKDFLAICSESYAAADAGKQSARTVRELHEPPSCGDARFTFYSVGSSHPVVPHTSVGAQHAFPHGLVQTGWHEPPAHVSPLLQPAQPPQWSSVLGVTQAPLQRISAPVQTGGGVWQAPSMQRRPPVQAVQVPQWSSVLGVTQAPLQRISTPVQTGGGA